MTIALLCAAAAVAVGAPGTTERPGAHPTRSLRRVLIPATAGMVGLAVALGRLSIVAALLMAGATTAWVVRDIVRTRAQRRTEETMAGYLGTVTAELRAGSSFPFALVHAADRLPETAGALRRVLRTAGYVAVRGGTVSQSLRAGEDKDGPVTEFADLVELGERHGIPLAELAERAQQRLDARRRHAAATTAQLQGPQSTAVVLTCLPLAGIGMGVVMGANPLGLLLGGGLGGILLVIGVALVCGGFIWSRTLLRKAAA